MKIQTLLSNKADEIKLSGSVLTINSKNYDLTKLKEYIHADKDNINPVNEICYLQKGSEIINLKVDVDRQFMFINGNDKRFYDKDSNNLIDLSELKVIVDHWNMTEEDRRSEHKSIMDDFLITHSKEDWKNKGL